MGSVCSGYSTMKKTMKRIVTLAMLLIFVPLSGYAQQPGMSEAQMQQMMEQAKRAQACMADIDQQALLAIGEQGRAMEAEVKALCRDGRRKEAERKVIEFGRMISQNENLMAAKKCGELMQGVAPQVKYPTSKEEFMDRDICDNF